jgi:hypothetical protein
MGSEHFGETLKDFVQHSRNLLHSPGVVSSSRQQPKIQRLQELAYRDPSSLDANLEWSLKTWLTGSPMRRAAFRKLIPQRMGWQGVVK